jgi:hypothetical protein
MDVDLYSGFPKGRRSLIFILFLTYSQIWLNLIVGDGQVGCITKLEKKRKEKHIPSHGEYLVIFLIHFSIIVRT